MALANAYTVAPSRIPDLFTKIRDGQAPDQVTLQLLKDWGFQSSNDRALLPILKALGFLSPDGKPTSLYHDYRDHSRSKDVMGKALKSAFGDLFLIKANPTEADKDAIQGKFKSFHNVSDNVAGLLTKTFFALLPLADLAEQKTVGMDPEQQAPKRNGAGKQDEDARDKTDLSQHRFHSPGLHYNIQIHLPATKDVEVYNSIFKSLKEHLLEK